MRNLFTISLMAFCFIAIAQSVTRISFGGPGNLNETSVAVNPMSINEVVLASNIDRFFFSKDTGQSWEVVFPSSVYGIYGDPVLHYADGQLFYAHLSKTQGKKWGDWFDRIVVDKVTDLEPYTVVSYSVGYNNDKMQDKPWLSSDEINEVTKGNLYVSWTEFDKYNSNDPDHHSRIRFSAYSAKRQQFSEAITISDTVGDCLDGDNTLEGAVTGVGNGKTIFAAWAGHSNIYFDKSLDGGQSWGKDKIISEQIDGWDMDIPHIMRTNGMPFMCYDHKANVLYLTWSDTRNKTSDVWIIYSTDEGESWSSPINLSPATPNSHQFSPNMVWNSETGNAEIIYLDMRRSKTAKFYTASHVAFNHTMNTDSINALNISGIPYSLAGERFFFGDYIDLDVSKNSHYFTFTKYEEHTSSAGLDIIPNLDNIPYQPRNTYPSILANKDSIHFTFNHQQGVKLKYKLTIIQDNKTYKDKGKFSTTSYQYDEHVLSSIKVDPNKPLSVKYKYKIKWFQHKEKVKNQVYYP